MELRWTGGDPDRARFYAGELVGMKPDVIFINHALVLPLLRLDSLTRRHSDFVLRTLPTGTNS
jgi:hypothetical protein